MYKYETHLHTSPVSRCATASVEEQLTFYKKLGYDGVFVTNHFIDGNINDCGSSYEEKIEYYFSDYEKAVELGKEIGIKVFLGVEHTLAGTDFLVYGLNKQWFLDHPEILAVKKSEELALMMESGALVIQAHPFREAYYIDHIRLFPRHVHGVEVINSSRKKEENDMASIYAEHYNLLPFAGSDNHVGARHKHLAGIGCDTPIENELDFVARVKNREVTIFTMEN